MDNPPTLPAAEVERWLDSVCVGGEATTISPSPTQVTMSTTGAAMLRAPVWVLEHHKDDWTATVGTEQAVLEDCCGDGAAILSQMNPEGYQMPFGTRVVCIKTQHLNNLHIAMQRGLWITGDRVGEKINAIYEDHDCEGGEKVLFIFSINGQRAFCALAEMTGPWMKEETQLPGWEEAAGSFNIVGSIPVKFTHVKNIANDHFQHIHHENPNQPITNMWNGMHFQPAKGREVVQIFHEKPHFTNVLCRDKRKPYSPFETVTSTQNIDPTITRKYTVPPNRHGRIRGPHMPHTVTNWRHGDRGHEKSTPTRAQIPRRIEPKAEHNVKTIEPKASGKVKTETPTQPRFMKREHVPSPLHLRTPVNPPQPSPSPRPGQVVKCIVDANGNYVPIGPFEDSPGVPSAAPRVYPPHNQPPFAQPGASGAGHVPSSSANQNAATFAVDGVPGYKGDFVTEHQDYESFMQQKASAPRPLTNESTLVSQQDSLPSYPLPPPPKSDATASTDVLRRAAMGGNYFMQNHSLQQTLDATNPNALRAAKINPAALNPRHVARHAYERNEKFLEYDTMRRQAQGSAHNSALSTLPSEYKDWASTSEVERQRIPPVSPLTDSDPFVVDSISKNGSPTSKAFVASVNREIRDMRHGQRAMPTPSRFRSDPTALSAALAGDAHNVLSPERNIRSPHAAGRGGSMDGGVPIPYTATAAGGTTGNPAMQPSYPYYQPTGNQHNRGLSTLSGLGQLPSSMIPAMVSAGQYAPTHHNIGVVAPPTFQPPTLQPLREAPRGQPPPTFLRSDSKHAGDGSYSKEPGSDGRSDLLRFTP